MITKKKRVTLRDGRQLFFVENKGVEPCVNCCLCSELWLRPCSNECTDLAKEFGFDPFYCYFTK